MVYSKGCLATLLASFMLTACASSTANYRPPHSYDVVTERTLNMPFAQTWDMYVAKLSESFFVINNISKESRIINVSFSSDQPSEFVDCGYAIRTSNHPATGEQIFSYETADDSMYNMGVSGTNVVWTIRRNTNLEGRINIYMAPMGNQTLLRANVRYVWSNNISGSSNVGGVDSKQDSTSFSSKEVGTVSHPAGNYSCRSRGILEDRLLNLI